MTIFVDERPMRAAAGDSVAAALLAGGVVAFRTSAVSGAARAPYCMIGNCFECLLEIDGRPDRQGCLVRVAEGMRVRLQRGEKAA
ncbi:MAG: (2Fe-2S)-binding protein [Acetobacteraceae bacterium]